MGVTTSKMAHRSAPEARAGAVRMVFQPGDVSQFDWS